MGCKNCGMIDSIIIILFPKSHISIIPIFFKLKLIWNLVFNELLVLWLPNQKAIIDLKLVSICVYGIKELIFKYYFIVEFEHSMNWLLRLDVDLKLINITYYLRLVILGKIYWWLYFLESHRTVLVKDKEILSFNPFIGYIIEWWDKINQLR